MALATLQSTPVLHCQGSACVFHFYFLAGEFAAALLLFSFMVGCTSFSFRQWDPVPAPNPATYTKPMWGSGSPLELLRVVISSFILAVLNQYDTDCHDQSCSPVSWDGQCPPPHAA